MRPDCFALWVKVSNQQVSTLTTRGQSKHMRRYLRSQ